MSGRLPSGLVVSALLRRVNDQGGLGVVRARGHAEAGAILVIAVEPGALPRILERGIGASGATEMVETGPASADSEEIESYWRRRRTRDPDLWVIELDVPFAERFAAETILDN